MNLKQSGACDLQNYMQQHPTKKKTLPHVVWFKHKQQAWIKLQYFSQTHTYQI